MTEVVAAAAVTLKEMNILTVRLDGAVEVDSHELRAHLGRDPQQDAGTAA